ncbi:MAG TPA: glycosyltransferase family 2 protein [Gemmatimonadaceae bacterium]|nr:glycosyltransferase family 2 protein [Gemmatimonadaceae bacterium]
MPRLVPLLLAAPWILAPIATLVRARASRSLADEPVQPPRDAPLVSLVIPARDEAHNIGPCVESALASTYPRLEVIVVDDHSSDGTSSIVEAIASRDTRLRVITPPALPDGWFGKQWACWTGAGESRGELLGFMDADTRQTPDLVTRTVHALTSRRADLLSVAGTQELGGFWERMIQPQIFAIMLQRYGGTEIVNRSRRVSEKIANGQCLWVRRATYDALGGHAAVKHEVAEDLALAQLWFRAGRTVSLVLGLDQLSTRMYTSLRELIEGWGKNIYAGGRNAMPFGTVGRLLYPFALVAPSLFWLVPPIVLALGLLGVVGATALAWAAIATVANLVWWLAVYAWLRVSPLYALLHPVGAAMVLYIALGAIARGRRVRWKEREYRAA